eukprot:9592349-Karenia_brevis.AAC.1
MIEAECDMKIEPGSCIWPWLIEFAADSLTTGIVGEDGKTAHERYRGRSAQVNVAAFGDKVLYKPAKTVQLAKDEPRWLYGVWLGILRESNEHIIGTERGVIKCRAITALTHDKRSSKDDIEKMRGLPWQP